MAGYRDPPSPELPTGQTMVPYQIVRKPPRRRPQPQPSITARSHQSNFAIMAKCEPELRTVPLMYKSPSGSNDVIFPECIRMQRCGGCCRPSELMDCVPSKVSIRTVRVLRMSASSLTRPSVQGNSRHNRQTMPFLMEVEQHDACHCACRVQPKNCDLSRQTYNLSTCSCDCKDNRLRDQCIGESDIKLWHSETCQCRCRQTRFCSTGFMFSQNSCR